MAREQEQHGVNHGRTWVRCTYCDDDGAVRCGGLPALECPVCFGSKHDYRTEEQRKRDPPMKPLTPQRTSTRESSGDE